MGCRSCLLEDGTDDPKKGTQLLEVYALQIQLLSEQVTRPWCVAIGAADDNRQAQSHACGGHKGQGGGGLQPGPAPCPCV